MSQIARPLFVLLLVIGAVVIGVTTDHLPAQIASHFGAGGAANGWMSRSGYLTFMLVFAVVVPLGIVFGMSLLPRVSANAINIPNRDHWLGPLQREATFRFLTAHACWLGSLMVVFIVGIHLLLIEANATQPPRLPTQAFITLMVLFLMALAIWAATLVRRFRAID
jgi:uncharacterized membrane protein